MTSLVHFGQEAMLHFIFIQANFDLFMKFLTTTRPHTFVQDRSNRPKNVGLSEP